MVDFHTHILPGIDDGSPDTETSVLMLRNLYSQGIGKVVVTPHFYMTRDNIDDFLKRRERAAVSLSKAVKGKKDIPQVVLGAEVLLYPEIIGIDKIDKLCIAGTNYLLVEMPFDKWSNRQYDVLEKLRTGGIIPIIAHVERYIKMQKDKSMIPHLLDIGCMIQVNSSFFKSAFTRRKAVKMLLSDAVHFIGSDCHELKSRRPDTGEAYEIIEKKCGDYGIENLEYIADLVLENATYFI